MKFWAITIASVLFFAAAGETQSIAKRLPPTGLQPNQLSGNWYMGTMSGVDCNMQISTSGIAKVQFGGCFHQDPIISSRWKLQGDRIKFQNPALNASLGSQLLVVRYKNHLLLFPERPQQSGSGNRYSYTRCFWRNLMTNGLQLSKDAPRG